MTTAWHWPSCAIKRRGSRETLRGLLVRTRKKRESSFTTRQGILLTFAIGTFFAVVFILVYYVQVRVKPLP